MAEQSKIEWCDSTFNPWIGCTKRTSEANWKLPLRWNAKTFAQCSACGWRGEWMTAGSLLCCPECGAGERAIKRARRRVFCASLADWLDNEVPIEWLVDLLELIRRTPHLDWLLLTKRIGNWRARITAAYNCGRSSIALMNWLVDWMDDAMPANVWIGATVCNQAEADRDVPKLLATPAAVRFVSIEPMLGPVDLNSSKGGTLWIGGQRGCGGMHRHGGDPAHHHHDERCRRGIDWVICGGESGAGSRPMHPDWVRSLRDQCAQASVPFLFKQWGHYCHPSQMPDSCEGSGGFSEDLLPVGKKAAGRMLDGVEHNEVPHG